MAQTGLHLYDVPPPTRCGACDAIELAAGPYEKSVRPVALRFGAVMRPL